MSQFEPKYEPLGKYLYNTGKDNIALSFPEIETILCDELPPTHNSKYYRSYWCGTFKASPTHYWKKVWEKYGYTVETVNLYNKNVVFKKLHYEDNIYIIKDEDEIKKCLDIFRDSLKKNTKLYKNQKIGFRKAAEDKRKFDVYWSPDLKFWSCFAMNIDETRYANWFNLTEPDSNKSLSILGEISISISGSKTQGKFVKDGNKIFVTHTGYFKKFSIDDFWNNYNGLYKNVDGKKLAFISELPSIVNVNLDLQRNVFNFLYFLEKLSNKNFCNNVVTTNRNSQQNLKRTNTILIKNIELPKKKKKLENINKREILNKAFDIMQPILPSFIGENLQKADKTGWWQNLVLKKLLPSSIKDLPTSGSYNDFINSLDISLSLKIIIDNWQNIFKQIIKDINFSWVHELIEIRNDVSHWTNKKAEKFTFDLIMHTLNVMRLFISSIDLNTSNLILDMIKEFEDGYED